MTITDFGTTNAGEKVQKITLSSGPLSASILTLGATLQSLRLSGVAHDLTLGSDHVSDYQGEMRYHGSIMAPVANRIGNAAAMIAGRTHHFDANLGPHCLHSGSAGVHLKNWALLATSDTTCTLGLTLPDGEGGFPGNRQVEARFTVQGQTLRLDILAQSDAETLWNATNHSYWTLDGGSDWSGHSLQIPADRWLPIDSVGRPTGHIAPADGSEMDFRQMRAIQPGQPALDNFFALSDTPTPLRDVLTLRGTSGLTLTVATTEPGVQVYDARSAKRPGRAAYEGIAIEAQAWPDAPSYPTFPSITLKAGERRVQSTEWRFAL